MKEIREQAFLNVENEQYFISTVNIADMYYETMVFGALDEEVIYSDEHYCERYNTEQEALNGHVRIIENIHGYIKNNKTI